MKKILIFSLAYYPKYVGGAEVAIKEITDRISPDEIQFDMITLRFDSSLSRVEQIGNVTVYRIGLTKNNPSMEELLQFPMYLVKVLYPPIAALKAYQLHRVNKYDGGWAMMSYMGFPLILMRYFLFTNIPYVLTLQEGDTVEHVFKRWRIRMVGLLYGPVYRSASAVQTISTFLANWARNMGYQGPLEVVPNAVDTRKFSVDFPEAELNELKIKLGKKDGDVFVITTSRLVTKNAVDIVIQSLKFLPDDVHFLVLGIGPDEAMLKKLAEDEGVASRVKFLGQVDHEEMPKYLKVSDIFTRPSRSEGMGNSFVEAMAARIPVVATAVGGITDFLFDPVANPDKEPTGLFATVADPKDTARAIRQYIDDVELRKRCVDNAYAMVMESYDWNLIAKDMQDKVFRTLLSGE